MKAIYKQTKTIVACVLLSSVLICNAAFAQKNKTVAAPATTPASMPSATEIQKAIQEAYTKYKNETAGKNANYIPYLANVDSSLFGISIVTADGKVYEIGDTKYEYGIESISKVFVLCMAMQAIGDTAIPTKIGVNATGLPFNSIIAIESEGKMPVNPFVNAGAMATNSIIQAPTPEQKWAMIDAYFDKFAARDLKVIEPLYKSEAETNQHNRAIAMLLDSYGYMYSDPLVTCDLYTKQCSFGVTAKDLAVMAATLANGGVNPINKEKLVNAEYVPKVLAVMATAGLYEKTGQWFYNVGVPAKSGVGGGIIAVVPGKMGISVFGPPLDAAGNSVRAQLAIEYIVKQLNLSLLK
jgi:glutaminase